MKFIVWNRVFGPGCRALAAYHGLDYVPPDAAAWDRIQQLDGADIMRKYSHALKLHSWSTDYEGFPCSTVRFVWDEVG